MVRLRGEASDVKPTPLSTAADIWWIAGFTGLVTGAVDSHIGPTARVAEPIGYVTGPMGRVIELMARVAEPTAHVAEPMEHAAEPMGHVTG